MCAVEAVQKDGKRTDWQRVIDELGPSFAERARDHDENDTFVAEKRQQLFTGRLAMGLEPISGEPLIR